QELPELIFLDLNMPDMDGWDFLEAYQKLSPRLARPIRIVILTSSGYHGDIQRAKTYPEVTAYLNKPLGDDALAQLLKA
ncbi:MAG: response regulator, partial [Bacteroidota bacterium]